VLGGNLLFLSGKFTRYEQNIHLRLTKEMLWCMGEISVYFGEPQPR
jgi:hypothetical protein